MATFIQQGQFALREARMENGHFHPARYGHLLICYDVGFIATAPSFIAMSQGNHMDLMTFLSSSACGCVPRDQLATFTQQGHSNLRMATFNQQDHSAL